MKLEEIWINPTHHEFLYQYDHLFINAESLCTIQHLTFKRSIKGDVRHYGLFNHGNIVGYLRIDKFKDVGYQVVLSQLEQEYIGRGLGYFMYDYVVLNDHITLLSDIHLSSYAVRLWTRLKQMGKYSIRTYNIKTGDITDKVPEVHSSDEVFICTPSGKTINETLAEINNRYNGSRYVVWYGFGTTSEDFFNY